jgi:TonB family protein
MVRGRSVGLAPEWDHRFTRMVGVSAVGHVAALVALVFFATRSPPPPLPLAAYTVEITDPNALGGRLPPGAPGRDLSGGATRPAAPEPPAPEPAAPAAEAVQKASPPEQIAKTPPVEETPPPQPPATVPDVPKAPPQPPPTVAAKEPEPVAEKKAEPPPKPASPKPEPPKTTPSTVPPKAETVPPKATPSAKAETKTPAKPVEPAKTAAKPEARPSTTRQAGGGAASAAGEAPAKDAYAAAAERWRSHAGGGLGGEQEGSGPVGSGGDGKGGGGQLVGIEFLSYRQRVIDTIKSHWTNVILRPGLVASVRFVIAPDGEVSDIRLAQSSNNPAYDASVMRAVQQVDQLPPPPSRYVNEFRDFQIEFHSEETGGRGAG